MKMNKHKWHLFLFVGLALLLASSVIGCAPVVDDGEVKPPVVDDGEVKPPLPVIVGFGATPTQISAGESATLLWNVRRATTVSIDQGIGNVTESVWYGVDADGQYSVYKETRSVSPASTTTYTLTVSNAAGTVTKSVVIIVKEPPPEKYIAAYLYEDGNIYLGGDKRPIELINNPDATDPTYAELIEFIKADITDTTIYEEWRYVCADFAEDVHNNAEAAGIRAAWVFIDFEEGSDHTVNAFETTDRGLVYIDGTGLSRWDLMTTAKNPPVYSTYSKDRVAYIEIGKEYGLIDIDIAKSLSYSFYEEHQKKWQEYETKLEEYDTELEAYEVERYEGSLERARIRAWGAELKEKRQELVELREELGDSRGLSEIVEDIYIYWGSDSVTALVISGVDIYRITDSRATIKWRTDERAISWVEYEGGGDYGHAPWDWLSMYFTTRHFAYLHKLQPDTTYHFRIHAVNEAGTTVSKDYTFITDRFADTTPPVISGVEISHITEPAFSVIFGESRVTIIKWQTDELTTISWVEYEGGGDYGRAAPVGEGTTSHSARLYNLQPDTTYHFRIHAVDESGNKAVSKDYTFITKST